MRTLSTMAAPMMVMLLFVVSTSAGRINETSAYQRCIAAPASCTRLDLGSNSLTGTLPTELGTLTSLTHMWFDVNQLTGTLPTELAALNRIPWMNFRFNRLTGTVPSELGAITGTTHLELQENHLTGTLPSELGALTSLRKLWFWDNQLTGTLPSEFAALTLVTGLLVCNNPGLCGDIPAGVTPDVQSGWGCPTALVGTLLGSDCPTSPPTASPSMSPTASPSSTPTGSTYTPTTISGDQLLKDNWFRKRDVARKKAFPQKYSWFRKQAKREAGANSTD